MDWFRLDIDVPQGYSDYALKCYEQQGRYSNDKKLLQPFEHLPIEIVTCKFRVLDSHEDLVLIHRDTNNGQFDFDEEVIAAIQIPIENPEIAETLFWETSEHYEDGWHFYRNPTESTSTFKVKSRFTMDDKCALIRLDNWHSVTRLKTGRRILLSLIIHPKYTWEEITTRLEDYMEVRT